jgi:hypothetical protein
MLIVPTFQGASCSDEILLEDEHHFLKKMKRVEREPPTLYSKSL